MANVEERLVIGLTGSFGSGCGEACDYLEKRGFNRFSLTTQIKEEAEKRKINNPDRRDYQNIGDQLREANGNDFLALEVIYKINKVQNNLIVIKSIRNHHEVIRFRKDLKKFFLFNVDAEKNIRFERCKADYTSKSDFGDDDERDSGQGQPEHGQHVRLCVDRADVVINNDSSVEDLHEKIDRYLGLIMQPAKNKPIPHETNMCQACNESTYTGCIKRAVGAVITKNNHIIASGYNDSPDGQVSCTNLKYCYRNHARQCPKCGTSFQTILRVCNKCGEGIEKEKLAELEKNLDLCRAIHAEERAILQVAKIGGESLEGATLYTTTFPCLLCAKKIVEVKIREVRYIDPYPFREAYKMLKDSGVSLKKFEGVKSRAFAQLYFKNV
ncbi:MAG: deaminase [Planctomycetota bacterium]|jgi:deoxycytidylate deaminase